MATVVSYTARTRRTTQALLLVAALVVGLGGYALVGLGRTGELPANMMATTVVMTVIAVALQIVVMWRAPYADPVILPLVVLLNMLGLTAISSYDSAMAAYTSRATHYAERQLIWTAVAALAALAVLTLLRDHRLLRRYTWVSALAGALLLLLPLVPGLGRQVLGARIWIAIGSYSFQPAEIAKIFFAIFFAGYLVSRRDTLALAGPKVLGVTLPRWSDFGPILVAWAFAVAVLVFETDLGTSLLFFGLFVAMLYIATDRLSWMVIGAVMFLPPAIFAVTQVSHVRRRLTCWLDPLSSANYESCYQIDQGLFGMANGGVIGTGLGQGRPSIVPMGQSDFIYSTLGEEMGMIGAFAVLILYLLLIQRALRASVGITDGFGTLLAGGLGFTMALQVFVVVGGVTRVLPLTGLTLPFLAAGGSSLVSNWIIAALLVRLSDVARRPASRRLGSAAPVPATAEASA